MSQEPVMRNRDSDGNPMGSGAQKRRQLRQERASHSTPITVDSINAEVLYRLIHTILQHGGALRIGATRDGGAWAIGIYGYGEPWTEYCRGNEDVNDYLFQLTQDLAGDAGNDAPGG